MPTQTKKPQPDLRPDFVGKQPEWEAEEDADDPEEVEHEQDMVTERLKSLSFPLVGLLYNTEIWLAWCVDTLNHYGLANNLHTFTDQFDEFEEFSQPLDDFDTWLWSHKYAKMKMFETWVSPWGNHRSGVSNRIMGVTDHYTKACQRNRGMMLDLAIEFRDEFGYLTEGADQDAYFRVFNEWFLIKYDRTYGLAPLHTNLDNVHAVSELVKTFLECNKWYRGIYITIYALLADWERSTLYLDVYSIFYTIPAELVVVEEDPYAEKKPKGWIPKVRAMSMEEIMWAGKRFVGEKPDPMNCKHQWLQTTRRPGSWMQCIVCEEEAEVVES